MDYEKTFIDSGTDSQSIMKNYKLIFISRERHNRYNGQIGEKLARRGKVKIRYLLTFLIR